MGVNYFTDDQVKQLETNLYVKKVSKKAITYTEEFREHFMTEYHLDKLPAQIFFEAGLDLEVLGQSRIDSFSRRVKQMEQRAEAFEDQRAYKSGRTQSVDRTEQEEINYLRRQLEVQKQQIEVLKKTISINRKAAMRRKKNSPSSNK